MLAMAPERTDNAPARAVLFGVAGRRLRELQERSGQPLRLFEHEQLASAQLNPGDELFIVAFDSGRLMLAGRMRIEGLQGAPGAPQRAHGLAPFWAVDFTREVPHDRARGLRLANGSTLRFAREAAYELHPAALLRPAALDNHSAASLDELVGAALPEVPSSHRVEHSAAPRPPVPTERRATPLQSPVARPGGRSRLRIAGERAVGRLRGLARRADPPSPARPVPAAAPAPTADEVHDDALSVHRVGLSNRAAGALWRAGLHTIGDVRRLIDHVGSDALLSIPGVGHTSAMEVEALLGMHLRPNRVAHSSEPTLDANTPIDASGLSVRSANGLRRAGALTLGDVSRMTRSQLEAVPNLGAMSRLEITDLLKRARLATVEDHASDAAALLEPVKSAADARAEQMAEMRGAGATLADIGSRYGVSRERVRQILNATGGPSGRGAAAARRDQRLDEARAAAATLLEAFRAGADISEVADRLGLSRDAATEVVRDGSSDRDRALRRASSGRARAGAAYTNGQLTESVRAVAAQLGRTPTSPEYNAAASRDRLPSLPTVSQRFGSWNAALVAAGLQPLQAKRAYTRRWNEDACWAAARLAARESGGALPSVQRYEQLAAERTDLPSSATLRNRLGPWSSIGERIATDGDPPPTRED